MTDMRRLGQYAVSVYEGDIRSLFSAGAIVEVAEGTYLLVDESLYSEKTGLSLSPEMGKGCSGERSGPRRAGWFSTTY